MNGPHQIHAQGYRFSDEIPEHYKEPVLLALPCNPFRLYVYWEHPAITAGAATKWFLRYFQSGGNGIDDMPELQITSQSGEQFLDVPVPGAHYIVELVQINADGAGTVLLRSEHEVPTGAAKTQAAPFPCRNADGLVEAAAPTVPNVPDDVPPNVQAATKTELSALAPTACTSPSSWAPQVPAPS